jgi:hypothetical protein
VVVSVRDERDRDETLSDASVAHAGDPDGAVDAEAPVPRESDTGPERPDLDAREARISGRRKPFGPPPPEGVPETAPPDEP